MTYASERARMGRSPCSIVEIDIGSCSRVYATAPCAAVLGVTGADRCYNSRKTCQDAANYLEVTKTFRFVDQMVTDPALAPSFQTLRTVSSAPSVINPGSGSQSGGLGVRATVKMTFQDEPTSDVGDDPYLRLRSYDAKSQGTFWGKFKARYPFFVGRLVRVLTGYLVDGTYAAANFTTKLYIIDSIDGPDTSGMVTVTAKDILKLADDERALAPKANVGVLAAAILVGTTSFSLSPVGIGSTYAASGSIAIGSEIMTFTRAADVMTVVRGTSGTTAAAAAINTVVQQCKTYTNQAVQDVIYDLLVNFAGISASYIDKTAWDAECSTWLGAAYSVMTAVIPTPTGVNTLVSELCTQGPLMIWWDERAQTISLQVIRPTVGNAVIALDDVSNLVANSVKVESQPNDRLSEVWVYYGMYLPTAQKLNDPTNFAKRYVLINGDVETASEYGNVMVRQVFCRWIPASAESLATVVAFRILNQYSDMPEMITFDLDAKDTASVWTGTTASLVSRQLQDAAGASAVTPVQVVQASEIATGDRFRFVAIRSQFTGRYGFITINSMTDFSATSDTLKAINGFISSNATPSLMPDNSQPYQII